VSHFVVEPASPEHVRLIPKAELHVHVEGAARPSTLADLARQNGIELPVQDLASLYVYEGLEDFIAAYDIVCRCLVSAADFERVTYESLELAHRAGVQYREMFFSPTFALRRGIPFQTVWQGLSAGVSEARKDLGIECKLILDIDKPSGPGPARELIDLAVGCDREVLVGIGGDAGEAGIDLVAFVEPFEFARQKGFRTTMHLSEEGPVSDIAIGVRQIGVDRVDHGFNLLEDMDLTREVVERQVPVTACPTSNVEIGLLDSLSDHPAPVMRQHGVLVSINSDNAEMFRIDLADEFLRVQAAFGYGLADLEDLSLAAVQSSWLDDASKTEMKRQFATRFQELRSEMGRTERAFES
jgi:adenosine deaminase